MQVWATDREPCAGDWVPDEDRGSLPLRRIPNGCLGYLTEQFRRADDVLTPLPPKSSNFRPPYQQWKVLAIGQLKTDLARKIKDLQRQLPNERFRPALSLPAHYTRLESKADDRVPGTIWDRDC